MSSLSSPSIPVVPLRLTLSPLSFSLSIYLLPLCSLYLLILLTPPILSSPFPVLYPLISLQLPFFSCITRLNFSILHYPFFSHESFRTAARARGTGLTDTYVVRRYVQTYVPNTYTSVDVPRPLFFCCGCCYYEAAQEGGYPEDHHHCCCCCCLILSVFSLYLALQIKRERERERDMAGSNEVNLNESRVTSLI